jgi:hypothetical protein
MAPSATCTSATAIASSSVENARRRADEDSDRPRDGDHGLQRRGEGDLARPRLHDHGVVGVCRDESIEVLRVLGVHLRVDDIGSGTREDLVRPVRDAVLHDVADAAGVPDVLQRIRAEDEEVRELSRLDGAEIASSRPRPPWRRSRASGRSPAVAPSRARCGPPLSRGTSERPRRVLASANGGARRARHSSSSPHARWGRTSPQRRRASSRLRSLR